jgi:enamine deaminase RidA (YjgF/YER057c/UK114 family)
MPEINSIEERLAQLGIVLPAVPRPMANYVPSVQVNDLLYLSGQGPRLGSGAFAHGKVGMDVTTEEAYQHARLVGIQLLAAAKDALGDLGRVRRVVKLLGMVNAAPEFKQHPQVINGCSDLFVEVFGDHGRHARSAVGMGSLPNNITVEIEAIFQVREPERHP